MEPAQPAVEPAQPVIGQQDYIRNIENTLHTRTWTYIITSVIQEVRVVRRTNEQKLEENAELQNHLNGAIEEITSLNNDVVNLLSENQTLENQNEYNSIVLVKYTSFFRCQNLIQGRVRCRNPGMVLAGCGDIYCLNCWQQMRPGDLCQACGMTVVGGFRFDRHPQESDINMFEELMHN